MDFEDKNLLSLINETSSVWAKMAAENRAKKQAEKDKYKTAAKEHKTTQRAEAKERLANRDVHIAHEIMVQTGNHYPDVDPYDTLANHLNSTYSIPHHEVITHLNRAAKKHLGVKNYQGYLNQFHQDYTADNDPFPGTEGKTWGDGHS